jgi:hypothetical protein
VKITLEIGAGLFGLQAVVFGLWLLFARSSHKNNRLGNLVAVGFLVGLALFTSQLVTVFNQGTLVRTDGIEVEVTRHFTNIVVSGLGALLVSALFINAKKYTQWTLLLALLSMGSQLSRYMAVRTPNPDSSARWLYWSISLLLGIVFTLCATLYSHRSHHLRLTFFGAQVFFGMIYTIFFVLGTSQTRVFTSLQPEAIAFLADDFFTRFVFSILVVIYYQRPSGSIMPGSRHRTNSLKKRVVQLYRQLVTGGSGEEGDGSDSERDLTAEEYRGGTDADTDGDTTDEETQRAHRKKHKKDKAKKSASITETNTGLVVSYTASADTIASPPTLQQAAFSGNKRD